MDTKPPEDDRRVGSRANSARLSPLPTCRREFKGHAACARTTPLTKPPNGRLGAPTPPPMAAADEKNPRCARLPKGHVRPRSIKFKLDGRTILAIMQRFHYGDPGLAPYWLASLGPIPRFRGNP
jgi:hypothetical protein